jgi:hypothetical protein
MDSHGGIAAPQVFPSYRDPLTTEFVGYSRVNVVRRHYAPALMLLRRNVDVTTLSHLPEIRHSFPLATIALRRHSRVEQTLYVGKVRHLTTIGEITNNWLMVSPRSLRVERLCVSQSLYTAGSPTYP